MAIRNNNTLVVFGVNSLTGNPVKPEFETDLKNQ
jgi:hypothetical protein